jgi:hypothetical protein
VAITSVRWGGESKVVARHASGVADTLTVAPISPVARAVVVADGGRTTIPEGDSVAVTMVAYDAAGLPIQWDASLHGEVAWDTDNPIAVAIRPIAGTPRAMVRGLSCQCTTSSGGLHATRFFLLDRPERPERRLTQKPFLRLEGGRFVWYKVDETTGKVRQVHAWDRIQADRPEGR